MPSLSGFSNNPFRSRSDLVRGAISIVSALEPYKSEGKARIKLPIATAAGFDDVAAQLEGFARPLWAVPLLLKENVKANVQFHSWIHGLEAGTNPSSPEYWGDLEDFDQRMVEMESISFALLCNGDAFLGPLGEQARKNLANWLGQVNQHCMPQTNWLWFRVFANLALVKSFGVSRDEVKHQIEADFKTLESFRIGDGWSSDGLWADERKQADYYSGSFAIQFAQLLYARFAGDEDETRAEQFRRLAKEFGASFWRYFDHDGAAIPFGRSMTYRFAFAAFWSAMACANVQLPAPFDDIGVVKGLLLRHLRWWAKQTNMFNLDGTMNIGFAYPNMYLSESYNSPQSVYWCLKTFIILLLPEDHGFWAAPEHPHPLAYSSVPTTLQSPTSVEVVWPPRHILCNTPEHHFLLSSGQMSRKAHKGREAKYGKFAYSSAFGFSVPTGFLLEQLAPDSTLCVSHDNGESWKMRSEPVGERLIDVRVSHESQGDRVVQALASSWQPWNYLDIIITTILIPPVETSPGWHVRVHRLIYRKDYWTGDFQFVDSGFALDAEAPSGRFVTPEVNAESCLLVSSAGASAIADLMAETDVMTENAEKVQSESFALKADPNTNLISPRTLIPSIKHRLNLTDSAETSSLQRRQELWLVCGVFAVAAYAGLSQDMIRQFWSRRPRLRMETGSEDVRIHVLQ